MIVTRQHLTGEIADFPIEVVQKMVDYQEAQGNEANPSIFAKSRDEGYPSGGFTWNWTEEGHSWWQSVIKDKGFSTFFEKFPKKESKYGAIILSNINKTSIKLNFKL